jgi:hypothetical protein
MIFISMGSVKGLPGNNEGVGIYGRRGDLVLPGKLKGNP